MSYIEAIQNQIDATSPILERIVCLCPVPERGSLNSGGKVCGKKRYDRVTVGLIEEDINHWQHKTRAVLAACFSDDSEYKYAFERTIVERRLHYDAKKELEHEVKEGRNVLSAIIEAESLTSQLRTTTNILASKKPPKVFIRTVVHFLDMRSNLIEDNLTKDSFYDYLSSEFAWFLTLNESKGFSIKIEDYKLDYYNIIGETEEETIEIGDYKFKCNFIRWRKKIGDKYYYYLMNSNLKEVCKVLTSFNNKSTTFHHSLYVTSSYFNKFEWSKESGPRFDGIVDQSDETSRKDDSKEIRKICGTDPSELTRILFSQLM